MDGGTQCQDTQAVDRSKLPFYAQFIVMRDMLFMLVCIAGGMCKVGKACGMRV
jgi:hypothetical protein